MPFRVTVSPAPGASLPASVRLNFSFDIRQHGPFLGFDTIIGTSGSITANDRTTPFSFTDNDRMSKLFGTSKGFFTDGSTSDVDGQILWYQPTVPHRGLVHIDLPLGDSGLSDPFRLAMELAPGRASTAIPA